MRLFAAKLYLEDQIPVIAPRLIYAIRRSTELQTIHVCHGIAFSISNAQVFFGTADKFMATFAANIGLTFTLLAHRSLRAAATFSSVGVIEVLQICVAASAFSSRSGGIGFENFTNRTTAQCLGLRVLV